ncbi:MAG: hypothetical protein QGF59_21100, partial [Pirellulaceae bacterium]|nr:hypothetical protein [Pirellulaceae bacterium]
MRRDTASIASVSPATVRPGRWSAVTRSSSSKQTATTWFTYKEGASGGIELYDMEQDPKQYTN